MDQLKQKLREDFRLKEGVDYVILRKYRKFALMCFLAHHECIVEEAVKFGIRFDATYTLPQEF